MTYYLEKSVWNQITDIPEGMNLEMINDPTRLTTCIFPTIDKIEKNCVILDMGCGTGLIGMYALEKGAKFVYFLEQDPQILYILENTLHKILPDGCYKIISKDIEELILDDFTHGSPDYATSEFYGPTLFDEGYINYTKCLRNLFKDIQFIPEIFETNVYIADVDYKQCLWPAEKNAIEQFKFMYNKKGFISNNTGFFDPKNPTYAGSIKFDANQQTFSNDVRFEFTGEEKIVFCSNVIYSDEYRHVFSFYGWYLPKHNESVTYSVNVSLNEETIFQPRILKVDNLS
tara:strand:- start:1896 stop:2756 length:861 start_codon:yes stop_codon:yes gene_type:complete